MWSVPWFNTRKTRSRYFWQSSNQDADKRLKLHSIHDLCWVKCIESIHFCCKELWECVESLMESLYVSGCNISFKDAFLEQSSWIIFGKFGEREWWAGGILSLGYQSHGIQMSRSVGHSHDGGLLLEYLFSETGLGSNIQYNQLSASLCQNKWSRVHESNWWIQNILAKVNKTN